MILLLSGPKNVGKTTIAQYLRIYEDFVDVEPDAFFQDFPHLSLPDAGPLCLKRALQRVEKLIKTDWDVVIPYPLFYKDFKTVCRWAEQRELISKEELCFITLTADEPTIIERSATDFTADKLQMLRWHFSLDIHQPKFGCVINTSRQTPMETFQSVQTILLSERAVLKNGRWLKK